MCCVLRLLSVFLGGNILNIHDVVMLFSRYTIHMFHDPSVYMFKILLLVNFKMYIISWFVLLYINKTELKIHFSEIKSLQYVSFIHTSK